MTLGRAVALAVCLVVALAPASAPAAGKSPKRAPACKTKKASQKAAKQAKRKRRCRPQAKHLRKSYAVGGPVAATPTAPVVPGTEPSAPAGQGAGGATPASEAPTDPTCDPSHNLGATAEDAGGFRLRLTRTCVPAGELIVNYRNTDSSDHDLWAMPLGGASGGVQEIIARTPTTDDLPLFGTATLTPGRWELFCSLAGHGAMRATVTVTP